LAVCLRGQEEAGRALPPYLSDRVMGEKQAVDNHADLSLSEALQTENELIFRFFEGILKNYAYRKIKICTFISLTH
jgi:hypothetical protein